MRWIGDFCFSVKASKSLFKTTTKKGRIERHIFSIRIFGGSFPWTKVISIILTVPFIELRAGKLIKGGKNEA